MREKSRARLDGGRLVTPNEISMISGLCEEAAEKEHEYIRKSLNTGSDDLLLTQYCDFAGLNYREVLTFLSPMDRAHFDWMKDENDGF